MIWLYIVLFSLIQAGKDPLTSYRWEKRILVINAENGSESYKKQIAWISDTENEFLDRDMILVELHSEAARINGEGISKSGSEFLLNRYKREGSFSLFLIGKDGGTKMQRLSPVNPLEIYQLIDSMPMRKREMREGYQN